MKPINKTFQYDNGLTLLYEEMNWSASFAIMVVVPAGPVWDAPDKSGNACLTGKMTRRGAGEYDKHALLEMIQDLGVGTSTSVTNDGIAFRATGLIDNWERSFELLALQIREPLFPVEEFEGSQRSLLHDIRADEDEPEEKVFQALTKILMPDPWGRPGYGSIDSVEKLTLDDVRSFYRRCYRPNGAIISVAGRMDWDRVKEKVGELFGDWEPREVEPFETRDSDVATRHINEDVAQTHICLGHRSIPRGHPDFWRMEAGMEVLGGSMSSRLVTEVREKRGLCYAIGASHYSYGSHGVATYYCGTTFKKAQQSLDVIIDEIDKLSEIPITSSELERMKVRRKSAIVMERESALCRVYSMWEDWLSYKRIYSLEETLEIFDKMTCAEIEGFYAARPRCKFRLATIGPEPLVIPEDRLL
ncbi:MAG: M16 family metallopeptidase [Thermoguttaceae bacterium]|jgi:predicted Zn-dependent peptidase